MLIPAEPDSHRPCTASVIWGTTEGRLCRSFARDARYSGRLLVASEEEHELHEFTEGFNHEIRKIRERGCFAA